MQVVWFGIPAIAKSKYFIALVKIQYKYFIAFVKYNTFTLSDSQIYTLIPLPSGPLSPSLTLSHSHTNTLSGIDWPVIQIEAYSLFLAQILGFPIGLRCVVGDRAIFIPISAYRCLDSPLKSGFFYLLKFSPFVVKIAPLLS
jgi:hypothetical protein